MCDIFVAFVLFKIKHHVTLLQFTLQAVYRILSTY